MLLRGKGGEIVYTFEYNTLVSLSICIDVIIKIIVAEKLRIETSVKTCKLL